MNVLKTKDLTKIYGSGTTEVIALNHAMDLMNLE